jgi:hypothetical protein
VKHHAFSVALLAALSVALPKDAFAEGNNLNCKVGPVEKTYGSSEWLVYSCDDHKSLVFVSKPKSAAFPFYFFLTPSGLHGEGTGDKKATDAAYADISQIDDAKKTGLLQETLSVPPAN